MLAKGYIVVATDYPGLGTPGIHPYLIGISEGRAVLDSVRAARALPRSGASDRFVLWGHSQGGHAVLYAGEMAKAYAPELKLFGVAAAAPATYLAELFDADKSSSAGKELTAMAIWSWSNLYNDPASSLVEPDAMGVYETMAHDCIESVAEFEALDKAEKPLETREVPQGQSRQDRAMELDHAAQLAGQGAGGCAGVPGARHRRHDRAALYHQAVRRCAVQARARR